MDTPINTAASGSWLSPASSAVKPSTSCTYSEMKKNRPKIAAPAASIDTLAARTPGTRKMEGGTSGWRVCHSIQAKAPSSSAAVASNPTVWAEPQPASGASTSAYTAATSPRVTVAAPGRSNPPPPLARLSPKSRGASAAAASPIGTFTNSTHSQPRPLTITPPSSTPAMPPEAATAPHTPSALLRSAPSG